MKSYLIYAFYGIAKKKHAAIWLVLNVVSFGVLTSRRKVTSMR